MKKREDSCRSVAGELAKAKDVIRKFMEQCKTEHQKAKNAEKLAQEQEKVCEYHFEPEK